MTTKRRTLIFGQIALEFFLLNLCLAVVLFQLVPEVVQANGQKSFYGEFFQLLILFNVSWATILLVTGNSELYLGQGFRRYSKYLLPNIFILLGITYTLINILDFSYFKNEIIPLPVLVFALVDIFIFRWVFDLHKRWSESKYATRVLMVGSVSPKGMQVFQHEAKRRGYKFLGLLGNGEQNDLPEGNNLLGQLEDLPNLLENTEVDEIFVDDSVLRKKEVERVIRAADFQGVRVNLFHGVPDFSNLNIRSEAKNDFQLVKVRYSPLDRFRNFFLKKVFDFFFALTVLVLLSPIFLIIATLILLDSRGPLFYKPVRKGEGGKVFRCFKFRTMSECDDPLKGTKSTVVNDPRITRVGRVLRKYDLDELPQFINVLRGEMSVVGPRPHRIHLQHDFRKVVNDYMVRHYVKPGITGWAQVNGWRGPTKTEVQKRERINHDLWYIENWSFSLDIKIIFLTVFSKKTRKNAF